MLTACERRLLAFYLANVASGLHHREREASALAEWVADRENRGAGGRKRKRSRLRRTELDPEEGMSARTRRRSRQCAQSLGLLYGNRAFLVARTDWSDDPRLWRLANMSETRLADETFERPPRLVRFRAGGIDETYWHLFTWGGERHGGETRPASAATGGNVRDARGASPGIVSPHSAPRISTHPQGGRVS